MTLTLVKSNDIETKAWGIEFDHKVTVGNHDIDLDDFCELILYVLGNSPLRGESDPRLIVMKRVKESYLKEKNSRSWLIV